MPGREHTLLTLTSHCIQPSHGSVKSDSCTNVVLFLQMTYLLADLSHKDGKYFIYTYMYNILNLHTLVWDKDINILIIGLSAVKCQLTQSWGSPNGPRTTNTPSPHVTHSCIVGLQVAYFKSYTHITLRSK